MGCELQPGLVWDRQDNLARDPFQLFVLRKELLDLWDLWKEVFPLQAPYLEGFARLGPRDVQSVKIPAKEPE